MCHRAFPCGAVFQAILVSKQHPDHPTGGGRVQQVDDTSPLPPPVVAALKNTRVISLYSAPDTGSGPSKGAC